MLISNISPIVYTTPDPTCLLHSCYNAARINVLAKSTSPPVIHVCHSWELYHILAQYFYIGLRKRNLYFSRTFVVEIGAKFAPLPILSVYLRCTGRVLLLLRWKWPVIRPFSRMVLMRSCLFSAVTDSL